MKKRTWLSAARHRVQAAPVTTMLLSSGSALLLSAACSGVPVVPDVVPAETGDVSVDVAFGHDLMQPATASFHVWVLAPKEGFSASCSKLVAGEVDPYDKGLEVLADEVFTDIEGAIEFTSEVGEGVVYVEGVNFSGESVFAGCETIEVDSEGEASAEVTLIAAGSYDCDASDTEDGSPCDDGEFCTTGETCDSGSCGDGSARDCSSLAGDCAAGTCSETDGCMFEAQPDDTPCDDDLTCTENDACLDGQCIGAEVMCTGGVCGGAYCDEISGGCIDGGDIPYGTPCDDDNVCTTASSCSYGTCTADVEYVLCPVSYCAPVSDCDATAGCAMDAASAAGRVGYTCSDNPCMDYAYDAYNGYGGEPYAAYDASCDGLGNCVGGVPLPSGTTCAVGCRTGTCDGSGSCDLTADQVDYTSCLGTHPNYSGTYSGQCNAGQCIY